MAFAAQKSRPDTNRRLISERKGAPPRGPVDTRGRHVYVLTTPSGYVKVGIARDPEARRANLQCGNAEPIMLFGASQVHEDGIDPQIMERRVHELLGAYRAIGEWFKAPMPVIMRAWKQAWMEQAMPETIARWHRLVRRGQPRLADIVAENTALRRENDELRCAVERAAKAAQ